ncbi:hypothetical protein GCM10011490_05810 [Pseudoclavibacter endophyticus]|uniref:YtxH domain-containing protein n=1 Tax=Pseudoclavibacter endophyticus TaxID=1778590 RepID=A0A6H9WG81_9MICO|nr:hypothetical protein [Pseudoclavibacter endophyticus]KAB1649922.1 hypothetical protein F8O04_06775 [Pseudoclavibacter endophyticus]GGA58710.1 hypothetical protein GCM10011490_05810 [Pseudoclavibacter endophyticus]
MKRVILVLGAGFGIGYVLGARAGRERYDRIVETTKRVATSEQARRSVAVTQELVDEATPLVIYQARHYATRAGEASKRAAAHLGEGAQHVAASASDTVTGVYERLTTGADDLSARVTHTTEELRARSEELRRRSEERIDDFGKRVEEQVERGRASQAEGLVWAGDLREQVLAEIVSDEDDMLEPADRDDAAARSAAADDQPEPERP